MDISIFKLLDAKGRIRSELDFQVNRKAELEIAELRLKLDEVRAEMLRAIELGAQHVNAGEARADRPCEGVQ